MRLLLLAYRMSCHLHAVPDERRFVSSASPELVHFFVSAGASDGLAHSAPLRGIRTTERVDGFGDPAQQRWYRERDDDARHVHTDANTSITVLLTVESLGLGSCIERRDGVK